MDNFSYNSWHLEQGRLNLTMCLFSLLYQLEAVEPKLKFFWEKACWSFSLSSKHFSTDCFRCGSPSLFVSSSKYLSCLLIFCLSLFTVPLSFLFLFCYSSLLLRSVLWHKLSFSHWHITPALQFFSKHIVNSLLNIVFLFWIGVCSEMKVMTFLLRCCQFRFPVSCLK